MKGDSSRAAYAIVEFLNPKHVQTIRRQLRKTWIGDKLLKIRTVSDIKGESHTDRTIIVGGLENNVDVHDLVNVFNNFGAVTSIELPTIDSVI